MLKKLKKTLNEEFKKRYEKMEGRYLGLENRIYTTIENRLANLEQKFEELSELLKDELHHRKEQNNDKIEEMDGFDGAIDSALSDKVELVKGALNTTIKDAKEKVDQTVEEVSKKVKKAKKAVTGKLKKKKKNKKNKESSAPASIKKDDLTQIKGLGAKITAQLEQQGIVNFQQLANLNPSQLESIDQSIKGFTARYIRYEWKKQANNYL